MPAASRRALAAQFLRAARRARPGRCRRSAAAARTIGRLGRGQRVALLRLQQPPAARARRPSSASAATASGSASPTGAEPGVERRRIQAAGSRAAVSSRSSGSTRRATRTRFTTTAAGRQAGRAQLGEAVQRLLHRHLLQQRDQVHRGLRRAQHRASPRRPGLDRPDPGQPGHLGVDVEEAGDPAGRRRVHHHRVVVDTRRAAAGRALSVRPHRLVGLAGQQHVAHARGDGGGEVDRAEAAQRARRPGRACRTCRGIEQRLLGVDGQRVDLAAARGDRDRAVSS